MRLIKVKSLHLILLGMLSISAFAHDAPARVELGDLASLSTYKFKKDEVLSKVIARIFPEINCYNLFDLVKLVNPQIENLDSVGAGDVISVPTYAQVAQYLSLYRPQTYQALRSKIAAKSKLKTKSNILEYFVPGTSSSERSVANDNEVTNDNGIRQNNEAEEVSFFFKPSYLFSTLNGESKNGPAKLQLLSSHHYRLEIGALARLYSWQIESALEINRLKFERPMGGSLLTDKINYVRGQLRATRSLGSRFSFETQLSFGESFLHRNNNGSVELYKVQEVSPSIGLGLLLYDGEKSELNFKALGGQSFITADQNTSSKGGLRTYGELRFSTKRRRSSFDLGLFYEGSNGESEDFKQDFHSTGFFMKFNYQF